MPVRTPPFRMRLLSHKKKLPKGNFPSWSDSLLPSGLVISQPNYGYRFNADAVSLARFVDIASHESLLDLCSGVGVVPLLLYQRVPFSLGVLVEIQGELALLARRNICQSGWAEKMVVIEADVKQITLESLCSQSFGVCRGGFDVISANPPYHPVGSGRMNRNPQKAVARHEIELTLPALVRSAHQCLKEGGRFHLVHRTDRENEILGCLERQGFELARIEGQNLSSRRDIILVEARKRAKTW